MAEQLAVDSAPADSTRVDCWAPPLAADSARVDYSAPQLVADSAGSAQADYWRRPGRGEGRRSPDAPVYLLLVARYDWLQAYKAHRPPWPVQPHGR